MVITGVTVLAIVRPWRPDPPDEEESVPAQKPKPRSPAAARKPRPRPGAKRHRVEPIVRTRRVPPEPGREEILLPEWLGPVSDRS